MGLEMKGRQKSPRGSSFKLMLTVEQKARMRRRSLTGLLKVEMIEGVAVKKLLRKVNKYYLMMDKREGILSMQYRNNLVEVEMQLRAKRAWSQG